jgi:hypothetical protein
MDFEWTDAVHLDDVALRDGEDASLWAGRCKEPAGHITARVFVELVTHSDAPHTGEDGDVFIDPANGEEPASREWIECE